MIERLNEWIERAGDAPAPRAVYGWFARSRRRARAVLVVDALVILNAAAGAFVYGTSPWRWGDLVSFVLLLGTFPWIARLCWPGLPPLGFPHRVLAAATAQLQDGIRAELERVAKGRVLTDDVLAECEARVRVIVAAWFAVTPEQVRIRGLRSEDGGRALSFDGFDVTLTCPTEIPGVGTCEVEGGHERDGRGFLVHRRGAVSWNGVDHFMIGEGVSAFDPHIGVSRVPASSVTIDGKPLAEQGGHAS